MLQQLLLLLQQRLSVLHSFLNPFSSFPAPLFSRHCSHIVCVLSASLLIRVLLRRETRCNERAGKANGPLGVPGDLSCPNRFSSRIDPHPGSKIPPMPRMSRVPCTSEALKMGYQQQQANFDTLINASVRVNRATPARLPGSCTLTTSSSTK